MITSTPLPTRRQALLVCATVVVTVLMCGGLLTAAALVPAPTVVMPFIVVSCVGLPMVASWELHRSVAIVRMTGGLRPRRSKARLLQDMRRYLDQLPETEHPLGR